MDPARNGSPLVTATLIFCLGAEQAKIHSSFEGISFK